MKITCAHTHTHAEEGAKGQTREWCAMRRLHTNIYEILKYLREVRVGTRLVNMTLIFFLCVGVCVCVVFPPCALLRFRHSRWQCIHTGTADLLHGRDLQPTLIILLFFFACALDYLHPHIYHGIGKGGGIVFFCACVCSLPLSVSVPPPNPHTHTHRSLIMVSVSCITRTTSERDNGHAVPRLLSRSRAPSLVALSFNYDGSRVAYAVRRVKTLPRNGACEDACCIFVANTNAPAPSASRSPLPPLPPVPCAAVAPLAQWTVLQVLSGIHDAPITALSWCQRTGALLSTSADRGACVWVPQSNESTAKEETRQASKEEVYGAACNGSEGASACLGGIEDAPFCLVPQIVMLSVEVLLCPTSVAWSVEGTKLYIGTSGGTVAVGRYDARQKWWICRLIDDHGRPPNGDPSADTSTPSPTSGRAVTALAAHPVDNTRIAVARLDGTVQVFSTHLKSVDGALAGSGRGHSSGDNAGATVKPFSRTYLSHFLPCCVHGLAWSPSGQQLAVVGHDSALHVWNWNASRSSSLGSPGGTHTSADNRPSVGDVDECEAAHTVLLRLSQVPLLRCEFASEDVLVAVGFEGRLDAFESSAPSTQPGVQSERRWQLVPQHTVTQRAKGAQGAADTSTHLLPRAPANVEVEDRELITSSPGGQTVPSRAGVPKGIVAHERQAAANAASVMMSAGQQDFESLERSGRAAAADIATGSPATQHVDDRPPHAWPINLLVRIPSSGGAAPAADTMDATFVSTGHDGCVHLWRVCCTTLGVYQ